jgi:disease resistance protein RPM1
MDLLAERWVPPRCLRVFDIEDIQFSAIPVWIKSHLSNLSELSFEVKELKQEDLRILGSLPALASLSIEAEHQKQTMLLTGYDGFGSLIAFKLFSVSYTYRRAVVFGEGALPKAEIVKFNICLGKYGDLESSLGNLRSLRNVVLSTGYATEDTARQDADEAVAATRHAVDVHSNRPSFSIDSSHGYPYGTDYYHPSPIHQIINAFFFGLFTVLPLRSSVIRFLFDY